MENLLIKKYNEIVEQENIVEALEAGLSYDLLNNTFKLENYKVQVIMVNFEEEYVIYTNLETGYQELSYLKHFILNSKIV